MEVVLKGFKAKTLMRNIVPKVIGSGREMAMHIQIRPVWRSFPLDPANPFFSTPLDPRSNLTMC
jgi:hypothetical protein